MGQNLIVRGVGRVFPRAADSRSEDWNQPRCWSEPSRYMILSDPPSRTRWMPARPGKCLGSSSVKASSRARIKPDIENVVDLFIIFRVVIRGDEARGGALREPRIGTFLFESVRDASIDLLVDEDFVCFLIDEDRMGTPQARWRETTQSGRFAIMPVMRFSPAGGYHFVTAISRSAISRRVSSLPLAGSALPPCGGGPGWGGLSSAMNHCGVLRKMTGFFERQECGYWCLLIVRARVGCRLRSTH